MSSKPHPAYYRPHNHHHNHHHKLKPPRPRSRPRLIWPSPSVPPQPQPQSTQPPPPRHWNHHHPPPPPPPPSPLQAVWSPQPETLDELLRTYPLPQLVFCRSHVLRGKGGSNLDNGGRPFPPLLQRLTERPLLLVDRRTARHLLARIVVFDERSRTFCESPDTVVIPEDYEGRFLRLQCRTTKDKTHVQSLGTVVRDDTPAFLNLSDLTSFPAEGLGPRDQVGQSKMIYTVGNVFLVDEPLQSQSQSQVGGARVPRAGVLPPVTPERALRVIPASVLGTNRARAEAAGTAEAALMAPTVGCGVWMSGARLFEKLVRGNVEEVYNDDFDDEEAGEVVGVQKTADQGPTLSVKSREMMAGGQPFPVLARYTHGKREPRLHAFSKLLTLLDSFEETSVIACTLNGASVTLLEIPLTSSLEFWVALNSRQLLLQDPRLRSALHVCRTHGHQLARDIKFKLKFSHHVQETTFWKKKKEEEGEEEEGEEGRITTTKKEREEDGGVPASVAIRTRLVMTETYLYI
ncbi:uncharacterized protein LOC143280329 [Babylonia areolata]|uniref:uncharacterized protein LOC143280329 n=1 Tax=Babylonia areolata TaxID=304850 RepID=UPI003FD515CE